jgi:hypothetical protein
VPHVGVAHWVPRVCTHRVSLVPCHKYILYLYLYLYFRGELFFRRCTAVFVCLRADNVMAPLEA